MIVCCSVLVCVCGFFFFKQKTAYEMRISDWSSDVCSSDLVDDTPEVAGDADRPRDGRGHDQQLRLDLVEQLERVATGAVPLVDEGHQRQVALPADLEEDRKSVV